MLILCSAFWKQAEGQDTPWSLQYVTNMHTINPAFVGMWERTGVMVSTKASWVGISGTPLSQYLGYFAPIKDQRSGVGLSIQRTNVGLEKRISITGDYSYQLRLDMYNYLRLGMRAGIVNFSNNLTDYQLYPDKIPDDQFNTDIRLYNMTTFGLGAVFFNQNFFASISAPQIINNTFKVNRTIYSSLENFSTVYLNTSYVFRLVDNIHLRPNLMVAATVGKPVYFDAAAIVFLPSNLQVGINLRSTGTFCFSAQYTFKNVLRIGYASNYELVADIHKYQLGTYEILIGYDFNLSKRRFTKPTYF